MQGIAKQKLPNDFLNHYIACMSFRLTIKCYVLGLWETMNLAEICDNAKKGREYALLGNYDSSMVYYQGVIQQIQRHCQSIRDPAVKGKWQQVWWSGIALYVVNLERNNALHKLLKFSPSIYWLNWSSGYLCGNISCDIVRRDSLVLIESIFLSSLD